MVSLITSTYRRFAGLIAELFKFGIVQGCVIDEVRRCLELPESQHAEGCWRIPAQGCVDIRVIDEGDWRSF